MTALDPWSHVRALTPSRVGLARTGNAPLIGDVLAFQAACAAARHAVHAAVDWDVLASTIAPAPVLRVRSAARDRAEYLRRPDLGRQLAAAEEIAFDGPCDIAFVIGDGLSAEGVMRHAAGVLQHCLASLDDMRPAIVLAGQARVVLGDVIGERLGARFTVVLIGERPGLSVPDSLGAYITYRPLIGRRDSERNCVSNIHARGGLSHADAALRICWLVREADRIGATGIALKDRSGEPPRLPGG